MKISGGVPGRHTLLVEHAWLAHTLALRHWESGRYREVGTLEDIRQEAWVAMMRAAAKYDGRRPFKYFARVVIINHLRSLEKTGRLVRVPATALSTHTRERGDAAYAAAARAMSPPARLGVNGHALPGREERVDYLLLGEVNEVIDRLPDRERQIVRLRFDGGLLYREIGRRMGMPTSTVMWALGRVIEKIKNSFGETNP